MHTAVPIWLLEFISLLSWAAWSILQEYHETFSGGSGPVSRTAIGKHGYRLFRTSTLLFQASMGCTSANAMFCSDSRLTARAPLCTEFLIGFHSNKNWWTAFEVNCSKNVKQKCQRTLTLQQGWSYKITSMWWRIVSFTRPTVIKWFNKRKILPRFHVINIFENNVQLHCKEKVLGFE